MGNFGSDLLSLLHGTIAEQHRIEILLLALLVCIMAAATTVLLLHQSEKASGAERRGWSALAGAALGFGAWSTHFITLLGYDSGYVQSYSMDLTISSLGAGVILCTAVMVWITSTRTGAGRTFGALLLGGALGVMHYAGLAAMQIPASAHWRPLMLAASLIVPVTALYPALALSREAPKRGSSIAATLLFVFAITSLHMLGMAAQTFLPSDVLPQGVAVSPSTLAAWVAAVALAIFATGMATQLGRSRAQTAALKSEHQFADLLKSVADHAIVMLDAPRYCTNQHARRALPVRCGGAPYPVQRAFSPVVGA